MSRINCLGLALGALLLCSCQPEISPPSLPVAPVDADGDGAYEEVDCDDNDPERFPGNDEVPCDGIDQDCDWQDGSEPEVPYDGIDQDCEDGDLVDVDGDGFDADVVGGDDCDDQDDDIHPGANEVPYDGIDQDCDGEDLLDADGDGYDAEVAGGDDCDDEDEDVHPDQIDDCWGGDEDCDGELDEDADADGDGYSMCDGDCNDSDSSIHPGAEDIPLDGINQDCEDGDQGNCPWTAFFVFNHIALDLEFESCASFQDGAVEAIVTNYVIPSNALCDDELGQIEWTDSLPLGTGSSVTGTFWGYYDLTGSPVIDGGDNTGEFEGSGFHVWEGNCSEVSGWVTLWP